MISLKQLLIESKKSNSVVYENEWLALKKKKLPGSSDDYFYVHENRCNGKIVAVLLYRRVGKDAWEYGVRKEVVPAWSDKPTLCALTGGCEGDESPESTAIKEVKEESGFEIDKQDLQSLGTCLSVKSSDTTYYLYAVNIADKKAGTKTGDGTKFDTEGELVWMYYDKDKINCPILSTMILRLGYY